jgi:hypothetical protein
VAAGTPKTAAAADQYEYASLMTTTQLQACNAHTARLFNANAPLSTHKAGEATSSM